MKRRIITGAGLALAVAACSDSPTAPSDPAFATGVEPVAICHIEEETGLWELLMVSPLGKSVQKHLAHGDAFPGDDVPGGAGQQFDANCASVWAGKVFAIAYSDMDADDGPGFKEGTDVLIARLIDANGDDVISVGDQVITHKYPTAIDPGPSDFGSFPVTTHTVTGIPAGHIPYDGEVAVEVGSSNDYIWFSRDYTHDYSEPWRERIWIQTATWAVIQDVRSADDDWITVVDSQVNLTVFGQPADDDMDNRFIDVEIDIDGF